MSSRNRIELIGNVGADPELRVTNSGKQVCNLRVATNERYKTNEGNWAYDTQWHRVVCWGHLAEYVSKYVTSGGRVFVEGALKYKEREVNGTKLREAEITALEVMALNGKREDTQRSRRQDNGPEQEETSEPSPDNLPF